MKSIINKIKDVQFIGKLITGVIGFLFASIYWILTLYSNLKTTEQMSLKSVIWNESIPLADRANACDVYLNAGYNSMTKKQCESILNEWEEK